MSTVNLSLTTKQIKCMASFLDERSSMMRQFMLDHGVHQFDIEHFFNGFVHPFANFEATSAPDHGAKEQAFKLNTDIWAALVDYFANELHDVAQHLAAWGMPEDGEEYQQFLQAWQLQG